MRKLLSACVVVVGVMMGGGLASAQGEDGWVTIFDGTSMEGWKSSTDNPAAFSIVDGTLKLNGERAHLFYVGPDGNADFANFELKLKVKTMPNSNSGVYLHTKYQAEGWPEAGYEAQVNASHKDPKKTGSLYAVMNMYVDMSEDAEKPAAPYLMMDQRGMNLVLPEAPHEDGEWFDYEIKVEDKTITISVNGKTTVKFTEPPNWAGAGPNMPGRKVSSGTVALQAHDPGSTVFFKDIQLKVND
jgi:hypothetical protein